MSLQGHRHNNYNFKRMYWPSQQKEHHMDTVDIQDGVVFLEVTVHSREEAKTPCWRLAAGSGGKVIGV